MEQSLADRGDGEELIDTKFGGVHLTDKDLRRIPLVYDMGISLLIMWYYWTYRCPFREQALAGIGDETELIDTKIGGVLSTDSRLQPSQLCLQRTIWVLACWLCGKIPTLERIDTHAWNKVYRQRWRRGADRPQKLVVCILWTKTYAPPKYSSSVWYMP